MTDAQQLAKYISEDLLTDTDNDSHLFLCRCKNMGFSFIDSMVDQIEETYDPDAGHELIVYLKTENEELQHILAFETCPGCGVRVDGFHQADCPELPVDDRRMEKI